jgi:hypothetical protein
MLLAANLISGCVGEVITTPIKLVDPDAKNTPAPRIATTATSMAIVKATITPTATVITLMAASYTPTVTTTETLTPTMKATKERAFHNSASNMSCAELPVRMCLILSRLAIRVALDPSRLKIAIVSE